MGVGNILGLLLEISADPSKAQEAIDRFNTSTGDSLKRAAEGTEPLDKALLSSRESARLLSEELGLALPRAVTSAISTMVPGIAAIGPVLLGAFAVEEIPKIVSGIKNLVQGWEGFGKAEQEAMRKAIQDTEVLHGKVTKIEQELELFGKTQAEQAALRAKWAGEDADKALQSLLAAEKHVKGIQDQIAEAKKGAGAFAAGAGSAFEGALEVAEAAAGKAREAWKVADEQALLDQKRAREAAEAEARKDAADAAKDAKEVDDAEFRAAVAKYEANQRAYHASEEALKRVMALEERLGREGVEQARREQEAREHAAVAVRRLTEELRKQGEQEARNAEELGKGITRQIADINRIGEEQERQAEHGKNEAEQHIEDQHREAAAAIESANQQAQAIAMLKGDYKAMADAAIAAYQAMGAANANYLKQLVAQHKEEQKAAQEALNAELAGIGALAEGAAQLAGSKKGYYAVKAGEEIAAARFSRGRRCRGIAETVLLSQTTLDKSPRYAR
jgi:hypothetical protein